MREKLWSYADEMITLVRSFKIDSKEVEGGGYVRRCHGKFGFSQEESNDMC